jgi:hypothetical protein
MAKSAARGTKKSKYSPHPMLQKEDDDKERLREATGKSFDEWVALARTKGPAAQRACREWLQKEHGLGSRNAWWIASIATSTEGPTYDAPEKLVDALYSGAKSELRPLHEKVVDAALAQGDDVIATSCKTMVPIYRKHVFAELRPVDGAVEVGLALGDVPAKGRLLPSDGRQPGDRLTHRVMVRSAKDVDAELSGWLAQAYVNGAGKMARSAEVKTPADFAKALKSSPKASDTWDGSSASMRREWIMWIESAKQQETRERRLAQALAKLAAGKKRMY